MCVRDGFDEIDNNNKQQLHLCENEHKRHIVRRFVCKWDRRLTEYLHWMCECMQSEAKPGLSLGTQGILIILSRQIIIADQNDSNTKQRYKYGRLTDGWEWVENVAARKNEEEKTIQYQTSRLLLWYNDRYEFCLILIWRTKNQKYCFQSQLPSKWLCQMVVSLHSKIQSNT